MSYLKRLLLIIAGGISLALGILGIFLPLLPTTPFVLLTAYCWARSSPRFHAQLLASKRFGPMLYNWETNRVIPIKMKWLSTVMMNGAIFMTVFTLPPEKWWLQITMSVISIGTSIWIWSFPHVPAPSDDTSNTSKSKNLRQQ